jgi:hypothetical protein
MSKLGASFVEKRFTDETSLPVTSEKQCAIVYLLHYGLHRFLESFDFLERLRLPHKVQSVQYGCPQSLYFNIPILLILQNLQM